MKIKVGDKVKIRSDLKLNKHYETLKINEEMLDFLGQEHSVTDVESDGAFMIWGRSKK